MFSLSLAAKCRLLFSLAVVLIIASALFVPWRSLETLVHDRNVQRARHLALLARAQLDPSDRNWSRQQDRLNHWWENNAATLNLPERKPHLIPLPDPAPGRFNRDLLTKQLHRSARVLLVPLRMIGCCPVESRSVQITRTVWRAVPANLRGRAARQATAALLELARAVTPPQIVLDDFQRECAGQMFEDDKVPDLRRIERRPDQPTAYRYILAVRSDETGAGRRPLIGLIDVTLDAPNTDDILLWTRVVIVLAGLLAGFLAILVFYLIVQKFILAPVRDLTVLAEEVAGGQLNARAAIATGDEFEELADAFNDMLSQLERSRIELETINRSLDTRLGELAETNVALFESNRLKSEFLANVSHELRTPLTSIIGFADLLRDMVQSEGDVDKTRAVRFSHNILTSGRMLLDLINDLLDLAKIEAGKIELHRTRFSLADICEDLCDFMRPLVDKKDQILNLDLDEKLPTLHSDGGKLRQILYNLLSNAVKYTPEGGTIHLEAAPRDEGQRILIAVTDTGPGIAPEDQEGIFEKFRQMDASVTREHSGSGLGLAISRELVHLLGGHIRVESETGKGARFIVELPTECPETSRRPLPSLS